MIDLNGKSPNLLVIGDLMVDHYLWGSCKRISPEAPVQVVNVDNESILLGGAGNVINNLKALGAHVDVISVIGDCNVSYELKGLVNNIDVETKTADRYRLFDIVRVTKEIILEEKPHDIYLNVASGSKIHAVGCMMACMIFDDRSNMHPYYAQAKDYPQFKGTQQQTTGIESIQSLPTYQIRTPSQKLIDTLQIIRNSEN